jgi:hypothetical protein
VKDLDFAGGDDGGAAELTLDAFSELGYCSCGGIDGGKREGEGGISRGLQS